MRSGFVPVMQDGPSVAGQKMGSTYALPGFAVTVEVTVTFQR
jgi:hypothetical protein